MSLIIREIKMEDAGFTKIFNDFLRVNFVFLSG